MFWFCYFWDAPFHLSRVSVDVSRAPQPPPSIGTLRDLIKIFSAAYVPQKAFSNEKDGLLS